MSTPPEQFAAVTQNMLQAGQDMAQTYLDFLSRQGAAPATFQQPSPMTLPDAQTMARLQQDYAAQYAKLWQSMLQRTPDQPVEPVVQPEPGDRRFKAAEWAQSPYYDYLRQAYLINANYLKRVADNLPIADPRMKARMEFLTRQYVDAMAPSNFAATNPEFVKTALETKGQSITAGIQNLLADLQKGHISMTDESAFEVGKNVAASAGSVVFENELMQLIQYAPLTDQVYERPLLLVPPCINKFYILDLQPESSFVRHAVEQGHTVFVVSWRNGNAEIERLGWDDYLEKGALEALRVVREISGMEQVNALGFCVGGTILSSALAVAAGRGEKPITSLTLMTTLLDFAAPGDLGCFIDEAMVAAREATIGKGGLLPGRDMATVFSSLRANDLIWNYVVGNYLKGEKPQAFDLLYWNADSTNLPGPFLAYYLRHMYLENALRQPGKLEMLGVKVDLSKIKAPAYVLATREDHIVPWQAAYQSLQILGGKNQFVLGASGHIAGAINPASKNKRGYWLNGDAIATQTPEEWLEDAVEQKGSWWTHWIKWLAQYGGRKVPAPGKPGNRKYKPIEPAPGRYVKQKS